ncbi:MULTISPECIES: UTP--glucose-1-phosphate uridylyltransferase GalU [unclassified Ectothiorhodospira]|uniref:UTP--glucose-1-phosphate uridylyltransferase GalU n=1 Tax=unclassified Ectothiorhodospira TaxID=2684909 RepID=UPI001EE99DD9|nr:MULTISPECIES: UTP--glucose-1-phosphate uridylyltransferase GalU [unclassified Ectothiorhodospira]MCG5515973.1 UTP--glucose-1-phosphate uridylyltransferase GalU [Ectothiorhodospira sp. 9100]MCG5518987.1 UTP--glucose-1-phosphate uridylyltransferase GalU [Ectothiorhodospira sp. 9905]
MHKKIRKAVFPVAGMGTRFLPATKANPKEMLPVVDKPLIQYAAEEAVAAGIDVLVFVTGRNKRSIPDHFDKAYELETELEERGKEKMLEIVRNILPPNVTCVYIRQAEALGLGHAVGCARPVVGDEPFAVILADDLIDGEGGGSALRQMVDVYEEYGCSILGVEDVPEDETHKYGVVSPERVSDRLWDVKAIVEKPSPADAPSNMAVVGRYILTPRIFDLIENTGKGAGGEIQLTDAISDLLSEQRVLAQRFKGTRYDCGSKLGYLQATVEYALKHPDLADDFRGYLQNDVCKRLLG